MVNLIGTRMSKWEVCESAGPYGCAILPWNLFEKDLSAYPQSIAHTYPDPG